MMTKLSEIIASFVTKTAALTPKTPSAIIVEREALEIETPIRNQEEEAEQPFKGDDNESDIVITPEFKDAFRLIKGGAPFIFVTGRAGTGKSTFISLLKEKLHSFAVVAPTGVAALNVGGQTIHSFFRFPPGPIDPNKIRAVKNRIAYKALKSLIIDEISMVRADLLDAIDKFLRLNGPTSDKPFGGVQIIVIGDMFQLPPIVASEEEQVFLTCGYDSPFFFSAKCLTEDRLQSVEFSKIFRQTEESFIRLLSSIREGKELNSTLLSLNERVEAVDADFDGVVLTGTNAAASRINSQRLSEISGEASIYNGEIIGQFKIDKNKLPAPIELELKPGAQVMFLKNDRAKRWVNGTIGSVVQCDTGYVIVALYDRFGRREVRVEPELWDNFKYEYSADVKAVVSEKIGSYKQIPLTPAWAITIHKSQGKTFDRVHIDLGHGAFAEGQVYVALSRCRTLEGVSLQKPLSKEDIYLNFDVISFYLKLREGKGDRICS